MRRWTFSEPVDTPAFYRTCSAPPWRLSGYQRAARRQKMRPPCAASGCATYAMRSRRCSRRRVFTSMRVSKWLGHSTFTLTLDVYGDYINEDVSLPAGLARPVAVQSNVVPIDRRAN